jgi:uncharacterized membrane protein YdbT with pleckstrin-like domain
MTKHTEHFEVDAYWRPSQWYNVVYFLLGIVAMVLGGFAVMQGLGTGIPWLEKAAHGVWAGGAMLILWKYLEIRCTRYTLSNEQFTAIHGVLSRLTETLELYRVKDTHVYEPVWLRLLGLGNVSIHSSDKTTPLLVLRAIPQASDMARSVRENVEQERVRKGVREFD